MMPKAMVTSMRTVFVSLSTALRLALFQPSWYPLRTIDRIEHDEAQGR